MLPEHRATSYAHDPVLGTVVIVSGGGGKPLEGEHPARMLLDATEHLVGVDVAPDSPDRLIVMLGPHESVARTEDIRVKVVGGGRTVMIQGSAAKLVAPGASPYVY